MLISLHLFCTLFTGCPTPDAPVASRTRLKHKAAMALKKDGQFICSTFHK